MKNVVGFFGTTSKDPYQYDAPTHAEQSAIKSTKYSNSAQEKYTYFFW